MNKGIRVFVLLTLSCVILAGCGNASTAGQAKSPWIPENDIISYERIDFEKTVLTMGEYAGIETNQIAKAIETKFPAVDIVILKNSAGIEPDAYLALQKDQNDFPDIIFSNAKIKAPGFLYDLSGEAFVNRYNLTMLNSMSVDGKLYQIPCADTAFGIWYNKTLFEEHGWAIPETRDAFYDLCDEISKEGIRAFAPNLKYLSILHNLTFGLAHDEIFKNVDDINRINDFTQGEGTADGLMEPVLALLRNLYERKIICEEDFSSSITKTRQALYAGKVAMIPYGLDMDFFYRDEKPDCELGFFGYPTDVPGKRWLRMNTGSMMGVSAASMEDAAKKEILLEIFDYLSTTEGQDIITNSISGVSNVNGYSSKIAKTYPEIDLCLQSGTIYYMDDYGKNDLLEMYQQVAAGQTTVEQGIRVLNNYRKDNAEKNSMFATPIGNAKEPFTVLETSTYIADTMRKTTGAQIALLPNLSYFKGNLARIYAGEITLPQRFYIKGLSEEDCLVTYEITGQNLKALLEHPYINGVESNILYAFSGLKMEYAPWAPEAENVRKLTLADGSPIEDGTTYTVAAWKTGIDERYLSGVVREHPELGDNMQLMQTEISASESIAPAKDGRITLIWDVAE